MAPLAQANASASSSDWDMAPVGVAHAHLDAHLDGHGYVHSHMHMHSHMHTDPLEESCVEQSWDGVPPLNERQNESDWDRDLEMEMMQAQV